MVYRIFQITTASPWLVNSASLRRAARHESLLAAWQLYREDRFYCIGSRVDLAPVAVLLTSSVSNAELVLEPVIHSVRRLWVGAHHPLLKRESVTFAEVAHEPYVMLTVDEAAQTAMRDWNETPWRPNLILRTSSVEAVRSMVANGSGVAVLSDMVYRPWSLEGRRIETIMLLDAVPAMSVGLAWRKNKELSPAMHAVREYFRHTFMEPRAGG